MSASPFDTYAGVLERSMHLIHTYLRNDPIVGGYQFWGQKTVNGAYGDPASSGVGGGGPLAMFQVQRGQSFRSPTLRRKRLGLVQESRRGTTHALFDVDDFITPGAGQPIPEDGEWLFLRVQENRVTSGLLDLNGAPSDPALGPIYCVPPAKFFGMSSPTFTLVGTAPSATGSVEGSLPDLDEDLTSAAPRAMYIVFPRPLSALSLRNTSANNLLVSFGPGQMMQNLATGTELPLYSGSTKEILLACPDAGGASFTFTGVVALG